MSDTPRTDKFYFPLGLNSSGMAAPMVMDAVEFARQLERELVEAEALAAELQDKLHRPAPPAEQVPPNGMKLVPVEPTDAMLAAAGRACDGLDISRMGRKA